jgi:hypothetical protein
MENITWNYYQFRRSYNYPIYIRLKKEDINTKFSHVLSEMGFSELAAFDLKKIDLQRPHTRLLTIQYANSRLQLLMQVGESLDVYGSEHLTMQAGIAVYHYRRVGLMSLPHNKTLWELALAPEITLTDQMVGLRVILVRYLSMALAAVGVLSYWGTVQNETLVIMKQISSFGEAVFIDWSKRVLFFNGGEIKIGPQLKILRKDKEFKNATNLSRDELIGFLSVSTCLLSFYGISSEMKRSIIELSSCLRGSYAVSEGSANL